MPALAKLLSYQRGTNTTNSVVAAKTTMLTLYIAQLSEFRTKLTLSI